MSVPIFVNKGNKSFCSLSSKERKNDVYHKNPNPAKIVIITQIGGLTE